MTDLALTAVTMLADAANQTGPDFGKASPVGLLIVVLLFVGIVGLVWSMNRHLKRLPDTFDAKSADEPEVAAATAGADSDQVPGKTSDESSG